MLLVFINSLQNLKLIMNNKKILQWYILHTTTKISLMQTRVERVFYVNYRLKKSQQEHITRKN